MLISRWIRRLLLRAERNVAVPAGLAAASAPPSDAVAVLRAVAASGVPWPLTEAATVVEPAVGPAMARPESVAGRLDPERTRAAIRAAAARGCFISYREVALASGLDWSAPVNSAMPRHLEAVCRQGQREGVPMLSAVVVRVDDVGTGRLSDGALRGFIACAVRLGLDADGDDGKRRRFLADEQGKVFAWAGERSA